MTTSPERMTIVWQVSKHQDTNYSVRPCAISNTFLWLSPSYVSIWCRKRERMKEEKAKGQNESQQWPRKVESGWMILMRKGRCEMRERVRKGKKRQHWGKITESGAALIMKDVQSSHYLSRLFALLVYTGKKCILVNKYMCWALGMVKSFLKQTLIIIIH